MFIAVWPCHILPAELRERASMLEAGMAARAVARRLFNVHKSTVNHLRSWYQSQTAHVIGPELAGYVSPPQHRPTISGYVIYVTISWLLHPWPESLLEPTTPELEHTVRRHLWEAGLCCHRPYFGLVLTDDRRRRHLQWGRNYRDWSINYWVQVLFCLSRADGRTCV